MNRMVKRIMVVLVSALMFIGTITTPVQAKGPETSGTNGWNPWGWLWGWGWSQPTEPEPAPAEEEPVEEEVPEVTEEPIEEEPVIEEETPVVEEEFPVIEEEIPVIEESVPVYATEPLYAESENYAVTVSFDEGAEIPEGTYAWVTEFAEGSEEYEAAKAALIAEKGEDAVAGLAAFDISLYYGDTVIEPNASVNVSIAVKGLPEEALNAADTLEINHLDESTGEIVVETVATAEEIAIVNEEATAEFDVDSFSAYTISWYYLSNHSHTINYVDTDGNSVTPTITPTFNNGTMYLLYDVEGYEYDSTHLNSRTGTTIAPLLRTNNGDREYYDGVTGWFDTSPWTNLRNNIYVVYRKKTDPTNGGVVPPTSGDEEWPEGGDAPQFAKSSINNGDGTNTISLEITAGETPVENKSKANVIVVFDNSGSMSNSMSGSTRIAIAKNAVNSMASTLLAKVDGQGNKLVKMALVGFSTDAARRGSWTDNANTFASNTYLGGLNADGGTNWEKALAIANRIENSDSDAATFIIFVTDGDPTFRISRGNVSDANLDMYTTNSSEYYRTNSVFGAGNSDNQSRNFDFAVEEVKSILSKNKNFYAIGISNDVEKVQKLVTDAGLSADHGILATDEDELNAAFETIAQSITSKLGFGDVEMVDGITEMTNTSMEVMHSVDENSFKYYRSGGENNKYGDKTEWTTREQDGCGPATYNEDTGAVEWNMGEGFQLEAGVTYTVTFRCWPSQEAYDLVADLNNGLIDYEDLTPEQKAQIKEVTAVPENYYALKTNTDQVSASYKKTTKTGDTVVISDDHPIDATYHEGDMENINLESMRLTIKKEFEDDLTAGEDRETQVVLVLKRRNAHQTPEAEFEDYPVPQGGTTTPNIILNEENNWTYSLYVAPGFEVDGEVLEHGYDFTIAEPNIDYHYGLIEEIINPMVVDGIDKYYGDGYLLDDQTEIDKYIDQSLTAVNRVKSGIDIKKVVVDPDGGIIEPDIEFTIKGKLLDPDGNPYTFNPEWDDRADKSQGQVASEEWIAHQNDTGAYHKYDKDGNRTIYKGHFASTDNIEFTLKAGESIRFINVPDGCTFEFDEDMDQMPDDFAWQATSAVTQHRTGPDEDFTTEGDIQPIVDGSKAYLDKDEENNITGVVGNKQYSIEFTNVSVLGDWFYVYHSSDNTIEKIFTEDDRVTSTPDETTGKSIFTFNLVNETKAGYVYGGYYKAYTDAKLSVDQIQELEFTSSDDAEYEYVVKEAGTENWAKDTNGAPYTGSKATAWKSANAHTVDDGGKGTEMHPESNKVYFLKEVPDSYLRPYIHLVYDTYHKGPDGKNDNPIIKLYIMTGVDDSNYKDAGIYYDDSTEKTVGKLSASVKITDASGKSSTLTAKTVFDGKEYDDGKQLRVPRGYLTSIENTAALSDEQFDMRPYFKTLDEVKVYGITNRTVEIGNGSYVPDTDGTAIKPGITATNVTSIKACE